MPIEKWNRPLMEMHKDKRIAKLKKDIEEVRQLTDNKEWLETLDMCEEDLDIPQIHGSIDSIIRTIRTLIRKQV